MDIPAQVHALSNKYINRHQQQPMQDDSMHIQKGHPVPIDNFMNAQCNTVSSF
jgi:hypothetical protein